MLPWNYFCPIAPNSNADNTVRFLILQIAADSEQVHVKTTQPTGELFQLMAQVGAIGENETTANQG